MTKIRQIFVIYEMRRYKKVRYYRRPRPAYNVNRKLVQASNWNAIPGADGWYASTTEIVGNPSVLTSNAAGSMLTIKHLQVQMMNLPNMYGSAEVQGKTVRFGAQPAGGWLIVYAPEGTSPNLPFPDLSTGVKNYTLYEPNQYVLGHGTWMAGKRFQQVGTSIDVWNSGNVELLTAPDNTPGNNMRLRCPLSKKLNPGDKIYMIFYIYNYSGNKIEGLTVDETQCIVSYASKSN